MWSTGWGPGLGRWCMVLSQQCESVLFVFWIVWCTLQLPVLLPLMVFLCSVIRWTDHWRRTSETVLRWCGRGWWESRRTVNRRYRSPCTVYWYLLQTTRNCNRRRQQVTVFFHSVFAPGALSSPHRTVLSPMPSYSFFSLPHFSFLSPQAPSGIRSAVPASSAFLCVLDLQWWHRWWPKWLLTVRNHHIFYILHRLPSLL